MTNPMVLIVVIGALVVLASVPSPSMAPVAQRFGCMPLHVCACERFFSKQGYLDDSRTSTMTDDHFNKRALIVGNGTLATIGTKKQVQTKRKKRKNDDNDDDDVAEVPRAQL